MNGTNPNGVWINGKNKIAMQFECNTLQVACQFPAFFHRPPTVQYCISLIEYNYCIQITETPFAGCDVAKCGWDLAKWLERLTANAVVATVLGSIPASSDTVESEAQQMKQCWKKEKNPLTFRWVVPEASHRMESAPILLKISAGIDLCETYRLIPFSTHLFSHWSISLTICLIVPLIAVGTL
jgi:hypothetical protein